MKVTDLMIDDWVMFKAVTPKPCQVDGIDGTYVRQSLTDTFYTEDCFEPIPLTKEILEKNGFYHENNIGYIYGEYEEKTVICDLYYHTIKISKNFDAILKIEEFDKLYVHQLQHALRICDIDLEIKL